MSWGVYLCPDCQEATVWSSVDSEELEVDLLTQDVAARYSHFLPAQEAILLRRPDGTQLPDRWIGAKRKSSPGKWCRSSDSCSSVLRVAAQAARSSTSFSSLIGGFSSGLRSKRVLIDFWET
jgi:hypothetical protein